MVERELLKGSTDSLLMALLVERPMYGYEIVRELGRRSEGYFHLKEGTLYPALHRLEKDGLIVGLWRTASSGQYRRYYAISAQGLGEFQKRVSDWESFAQAVSRVMASSVTRA